MVGSPFSIHAPQRAAAVALAALLYACGPASAPTPEATNPVMVVLPFEVVGQEEGAEFVSQALVGSVTRNLSQVEGLELASSDSGRRRAEVLGQDRADTADPGATHSLSGQLHRSGETVRFSASLKELSTGSTLWETELHSGSGDLSHLATCLAFSSVQAVGLEPTDHYRYVGNLACESSQGKSETVEALDRFRGNDLAEFLRQASTLVTDQPEEPGLRAIYAAALAQSWDAAPTEKTLAQLREQMEALNRLDPSNPYGDIFLAFVYRSSGEPGWAQQLYARVLRRTDLTISARSWTLRQSSYAALQIGEADAARKDAEQAAALDPTEPATYFALSRALESLGEREAAVEASRRALALDPLSWRYHQRLGLALTRMERYDEAIDHGAEACQLSGRQDACANYSVTLQRAGRTQEAQTMAAHAEGLAPSPWGLYNIACLRALAGQQSQAIANLDRSLELGFADVIISNDSDLDSLRHLPAFDRLVSEATDRFVTRRELTKRVFPWQ